MTRSLLLVALAAFAFSACDSTEDAPPVNLNVQTATDVYAPLAPAPPGPPVASGPYKLYSLRTNRVVANADSATTSWDLGFRSTEIIVNGGTSGPGQGQAVVVPNAFAEVTAAPAATEFRTDGTPTCPGGRASRAICEGTGNGWYTYDGATMIVSPTAGRTIVVRTADGAGYAKVQIRSYYQGAPAAPTSTSPARYYTFDFVLNPSGTSFVPAE